MSSLTVPLSALSPVWQYTFGAIKYKVNALEEAASLKIHPSVADKNNNSIKDSFLSNRRIVQMDSMIECVESLVKSFFGFSYNGAVALLAGIPALIRWNSQPIFPNVKMFWKKRVCIAGLSFMNSISGLVVLVKFTGLLHAISSVICYCKPTLRPTFDPISKMPDEDFQWATAMVLSGLVACNIDQKSIIDEINGLLTLILCHLKPKIVEKTSQINRLISSKPTNPEDFGINYDKKCSDILNRLNKAEDLHGLKTIVFNLAKDGLINAADVCDSKTTSVAKQASLIVKHAAQGVKNVVEETSPGISAYYQTGFSTMKDSLNAANGAEDVRLAVGDFCTVISQIFSGLAMSVKYEKNRCMTEIRSSLEKSGQIQEEEFFDAEDNQPWVPETIV
ncbi:MAG: hypothetical protein C5B45_02400 [Chlamydiae bacterium]|nr:MAG: hypothetical protein C5B45_02400 [Chlamydiota bacterium]